MFLNQQDLGLQIPRRRVGESRLPAEDVRFGERARATLNYFPYNLLKIHRAADTDHRPFVGRVRPRGLGSITKEQRSNGGGY